MDRRLVLTTESARHPIRRMLPPPPRVVTHDQDGDVKLFVLSFTAFFICFYSFIM